MCDTCGCGDPEKVSVELHDRILSTNDRAAAHNREHFAAQRLLAVNLMGSPGAGKTAVLERTARALDGHRRMAAVAGDLETERDADRLKAAGVPAVAITTGSACHLDAPMVHRAVHGLSGPLDYLFVENVGNLVCPAVYDLGEAKAVVALSVTEGEDKPLKYPVMFRRADLVLVTKCDLLPHLDLRMDQLMDALARVMPDPRVILFSARTGVGVSEWLQWLEDAHAAVAPPAVSAHGHAHSHDH